MEVRIDGDGKFPDMLVGKWRSDNELWEFNFEPGGTISSAMISLGLVRMQPGKTTTVPMKLGGQGVFEPGLWTVSYLQRQRTLTVEISVENFRTELGEDVVHGKSLDIFAGSVSKDGTLWLAEHFSYPEFIVDTKTYHSYTLPSDPNENPKERLLFKKISD